MILRFRGDSIELQKAIKLAGAADTGGQAKELIARGAVAVNGETETRRSRKLRNGDVVAIEGVAEVLEVAATD